MKKLLLLSLAIAFAAFVNAQTIDKKWGIGIGVGAYGTFNNGGIGLMPELYLGRYLSPRLDIELKSDVGLFRSNLKNSLDLVNPFLNLKLKLSDEGSNLRPYIFAGPGYLYDNYTEALNFDLGLGAKFYMSQNTAFYMEAAYIRGLESTTYDGITERENLWKATVGLEFDCGKAKDADMDGVSDKKDKCPNTPTGTAVDANGCPLDTDGDGVADYIDECPTVVGLTSLKGCPDTDKDGIADKDDACPEVAGLMSMKGCPDIDGDGITNMEDKCPDTPKGYKVDASGCSIDTDKDGVVDEADKCPSIAGNIENKGCPEIEVAVKTEVPAMTVEPVYFDYDNINYINGEKSKIDQLVKILKSDINLKVNLTGNADNVGTEEYNRLLTEKRMDAVVNTIQASGIPENRISKEKALGETKPIATNDTSEGRALNRRVTFEVIKTK